MYYNNIYMNIIFLKNKKSLIYLQHIKIKILNNYNAQHYYVSRNICSFENYASRSTRIF